MAWRVVKECTVCKEKFGTRHRIVNTCSAKCEIESKISHITKTVPPITQPISKAHKNWLLKRGLPVPATVLPTGPKNKTFGITKKEQRRIDRGKKKLKRFVSQKNKIQALEAKVRRLEAKHVPQEKTGFYYSPEWRQLRYRVLQEHFKDHGRKCLLCGRSGRSLVLHVDHIKPRSKYPELELVYQNLQVLCEDCNMGKSNKDETDWRIE